MGQIGGFWPWSDLPFPSELSNAARFLFMLEDVRRCVLIYINYS